jgi:hypothetical protein
MSYEGPERRQDSIDLAARVRDLEEEARSGGKSRQAMHRQLGDLNTKVDLVLTKMDEKAEAITEQKMKTLLLENKNNNFEIRLDTVEDNQKWATRGTLSALATAAAALAVHIWKMAVGK